MALSGNQNVQYGPTLVT